MAQTLIFWVFEPWLKPTFDMQILTSKINRYFINLKLLTKYSDPLSDAVLNVTDMSAELPNYLQCNKGRFPYWFGVKDPRNEFFRKSLRKFRKSNKFKVTNECPYLFNLAYVKLGEGNFGTVETCPKDTEDRK